jgi:enoyl-CoA hydratase/carnithine racemase
MYNLGKPAIAMVNGAALAAGCTIAFSCDCIIASEKARIGYPEINVGLMPALHLILVPRLVGKHKAFELLFSGEPISAPEAERIGLINRAVPPEKLEEAVYELAGKMASKSPLVVKYCRDAFYRGLDMEFRKGIADAADVLCILVQSEDTREGMRAFAEKRAPLWKGR